MDVVVAAVAEVGNSARLPVEGSLSDLIFERDGGLIIHTISSHARCMSSLASIV